MTWYISSSLLCTHSSTLSYILLVSVGILKIKLNFSSYSKMLAFDLFTYDLTIYIYIYIHIYMRNTSCTITLCWIVYQKIVNFLYHFTTGDRRLFSRYRVGHQRRIAIYTWKFVLVSDSTIFQSGVFSPTPEFRYKFILRNWVQKR